MRRGDGTEVTNTLSAGSDHVVTTLMFRLLPFIVRPMMAKQLRKELAQLKAILEGDGSGEDSAALVGRDGRS